MKSKLTLTFLSVFFSIGLARAQYCTTTGTTNCSFESITNVTFSGINNSTGCTTGGYSDYTSGTAAVVIAGLNYTLSVTIAADANDYVSAWIDWNNNQIFDASEEYILAVATSSNGPFTASVNVPSNAYIGTTRMRVRVVWAQTAQACNVSTSFGETEDYAVTVLAPELTLVAPDTVNLLCYGDSNGVIGTFTAGGVSPYTYLWNTGSTNDTLFNAPAGTYSVIVTDDNGDMDTAQIAVVQPDSISSSVSILQDLVCHYDVSQVEVTASGGSPISGYFIDTASANYHPDSSMVGTTVTLSDDQNSPALNIGFDFEFFGNTYNQFYIGSNGYLTFSSGTWGYEQQIPNATVPNNLIALAWEDLYPPSGGSITYYTTGTAPYRKLVVNFKDISYFITSTPDVTVQAILYESTNCIEIHTTNAGFSASAQEQTQGIENADGTEAYWYPGRNFAVWNATNSYISFCPVDTTGLLYSWSTGDNGSTVTGLEAGTYTVTVSDLNGCFNEHEVTINSAVSNLTSAVAATDVNCFGAANGSIDPGVTGGVQPYTFLWSNSETTATVSDLGPGTYDVSVLDNVGCTIDVTGIVITEPEILLAIVNGVTNVVCPGDTTGSASAVAAGGVAPYTYSWLPSGFGGSSVTGLTNGTQNLVVTDANGCQSYASVTVLATSSTPSLNLGPDLFSGSGETFTLNAGNHAGYLWSNNSTGSTLNVTASGTYWVEVTNADGCTARDTVVVEIWPLGINDPLNSFVQIYPNPASQVLNIQLNASVDKATFTLIDARGAVVHSQEQPNTGLQTIDVSQLPAGVYTLSVRHGQEISMHQVVVTR